MKYPTTKRGFTMFFAVLVSGLALAIGAVIYDLVVRELALSQTTLQSQYAIFAADTGAECALYWDAKCTSSICSYIPAGGAGSIFATSSASNRGGTGALCGGVDIVQAGAPDLSGGTWQVVTGSSPVTYATTTFAFQYQPTGVTAVRCVKVEVGKYMDGAIQRTLVYSHGYSSCDINSPQRVERLLQVRY